MSKNQQNINNVKSRWWWIYKFIVLFFPGVKILIRSCKIKSKLKNMVINMFHL